jgi:2-octaprenyl-6-methoxyphenol hydroxylase
MSQKSDVIIAGAALNGLAAAVALSGSQARRPVTTTIVDAKDPRTFTQSSFDGRASAITASAKRMFEALGIWPEIAGYAQPMREIIVTDAKGGANVRPSLLQFGEQDMGGAPSSYMIENRHLYDAMLKATLASPYITLQAGQPISSYSFGPGLARVSLGQGEELKAQLVVAADGRNSQARTAAGIELVGWTYDQVGIVATVSHEKSHNGRAEEHFRPPGPFAILPLPGNQSSLVWTEAKADAERILALDDEGFLAELRSRFGNHLGEVRLVSGRHGYPLALFVAREFAATRLALIGDAAHVLHPLAGLGFNLGLRDVAALAECVSDAVALGQDVGGAAVLDRYATWRRFDTLAAAAAMDGLNRLFSNDNAAVRLIRDVGLMAVNRLPAVKRAFTNEAAGKTGTQPKLLRGLPL